jgi:cation:H+ antiporter
MTLGAGALARPLQIEDANALHVPWLLMLASLSVVIGLVLPSDRLGRRAGFVCLGLYPLFAVVVLAVV